MFLLPGRRAGPVYKIKLSTLSNQSCSTPQEQRESLPAKRLANESDEDNAQTNSKRAKFKLQANQQVQKERMKVK